MRFQSTHPRGVRPAPLALPIVVADFNPRTREGCDGLYARQFHARSLISIHAPARGATIFLTLIARVCRDFNPRTREGCDRLNVIFATYKLAFQSTHPRGVRHTKVMDATSLCTISIHAPARGATRFNASKMGHKARFQSTHPRGVRRFYTVRRLTQRGFQSTHPRGVRLWTFLSMGGQKGFQSTHPRGVRHIGRRAVDCYLIFQSTHPRGVRPGYPSSHSGHLR